MAVETHETDGKQKRKGKDIPYIIHPLTVGLILAKAGASEEVIIAGILHDTIEDSIAEKKVSKEMIEEIFGNKVMNLVLSVTEPDRSLPWEERKQEALEHIQSFSEDSLLLKSADVIANNAELVMDYQKEGGVIFERFSAPKEKLLPRYVELLETILKKWPENPLAEDLKVVLNDLNKIIELENIPKIS